MLAEFTAEAGGPISLLDVVVVGAVDCWVVVPPHVTGRETTVAGFLSFVVAARVAIFCKSAFVETELVMEPARAAVEVVEVILCEDRVFCKPLASILNVGIVVGVMDVSFDVDFESGVSTLFSDCSFAGLPELSGVAPDVDDETAVLTEDVGGFEIEVFNAGVVVTLGH